MASAAAAAEERLLSGWGRTAPTLGHVSHPRSASDVEAALAAVDGRGAIARGLGRSYGDAAQNAGGLVLDMTALADVREFEAESGRVTVGAGMSLEALIQRTLPHGWFVAVTPGTRHVTVGGAIASDIHGKNHHRDGGFCRHVLGFELLTPRGERLTVTPESDPDAFWATAGGMGLTGVVIEATLQLIPVETDQIKTDTERAANLDELMAAMEERDEHYRYSVAWIDCLARGASMGRGILIRGDHAARDELPAKGREAAPELRGGAPLAVPGWVPGGLLRTATVRAFNEAWFRKAPRRELGRLEPLAPFFYPLDAVRDWNRLYGPSGFLQYQFAVPFGEEATLRRLVERLSAARCPSFLAVLKRFGPRVGMLSFPIEGWTLALDIPTATPGLAALLDSLDEQVADAGGRVYLSKDSRLRPDLLRRMYPELDRWREVRARLDPDGAMRSDLSRRLALA